ncbi:MAG: patatin-like phospholipase family protein [Actinomycetota bacterium]
MTVAIVLGAGGPLGWAYHLGIIEGVRDAIGREPANADRIVGTSAGAAIAATLLTGTPTEKVLDLISTPPSGEDQERMRSAGSDALRNPLSSLRPVAPGLVRRVGQVGVVTALVGMLPGGFFPTIFLRRFGADVPWPDPLWIPSVRLDDGQVVVFGRDSIPCTLGDAIEATSAVPAVFQPKVIDGARYVDGAVASSTHADVVAAEGHDVVLIAAPMARPGRGPIRARARRTLDDEVRTIRAAGSRTLVLRPDAAALEAADGFPRTRPDAGSAIVEAARQQTIEAFRTVRERRRGDS